MAVIAGLIGLAVAAFAQDRPALWAIGTIVLQAVGLVLLLGQ